MLVLYKANTTAPKTTTPIKLPKATRAAPPSSPGVGMPVLIGGVMVPLVVALPVGTGRPADAIMEEMRVVGAAVSAGVGIVEAGVSEAVPAGVVVVAAGVSEIAPGVVDGVTTEVGAGTVEVMDGTVISTPASLQI